MGYYLQMDGVDDRILLPSMTMTEIELDFSFKPKATGQQRFWSFPFGASYFMRNNTFDEFHASTHSDFKVNGVSVTNSTVFIPSNERVVARSILNAAMTQQTHIFNNNGSSAFVEGNIYRIKVFNGSTLMADYDLSTGDVQDKSGNGRHATLFGGTWVQEATMEPTPTPIQVDYSTKQSFYKQTTVDSTSKQSIFNQSSIDSRTKQIVYKPTIEPLTTKQIIYKQTADDFSTTQTITALSSAIYDFSTKQVIYKQSTADYQTKQLVYKSVSESAAAKQIIYKQVTGGFLMNQTIIALMGVNFDIPIKQTIYTKTTQDGQVNARIFKGAQAQFPLLQSFYSGDSDHYDVIEMIVSINRMPKINTKINSSLDVSSKITSGGEFVANI